MGYANAFLSVANVMYYIRGLRPHDAGFRELPDILNFERYYSFNVIVAKECKAKLRNALRDSGSFNSDAKGLCG